MIDTLGIQGREPLMRAASLDAGGMFRAQDRNLMAVDKIMEVHVRAPICKRERVGLSAAGAYEEP